MVMFAFIFGLRESSVMNVKVRDVFDIREGRCEVLVRFLKGRTEVEAVRRGPRVYTHELAEGGLSPLAIIVKHMTMRGSSSPYLFNSARPPKGWMQKRLEYLLESEAVRAPEGCCYSTHSMRLGSLTERILCGGHAIALLALYDWAYSSQGMLSVYFDRRITISQHSRWFFGTAE